MGGGSTMKLQLWQESARCDMLYFFYYFFKHFSTDRKISSENKNKLTGNSKNVISFFFQKKIRRENEAYCFDQRFFFISRSAIARDKNFVVARSATRPSEEARP